MIVVSGYSASVLQVWHIEFKSRLGHKDIFSEEKIFYMLYDLRMLLHEVFVFLF